MTKIIFGEHIKGGTGLSSILVEVVTELSKNNKVLVLDLTENLSLISFFTDNKYTDVYEGDNQDITKVNDNLHVTRLTKVFHVNGCYIRYGCDIDLSNVVYEYDYVVVDTDRSVDDYSLCGELRNRASSIINVIEPDVFSIQNITTEVANKNRERIIILNKVHTDYTLREVLEEDEDSINLYKEFLEEKIKPMLRDEQYSISKLMTINYTLSITDNQLEYKSFITMKHKDYTKGDLQVYMQIKNVINEVR